MFYMVLLKIKNISTQKYMIFTTINTTVNSTLKSTSLAHSNKKIPLQKFFLIKEKISYIYPQNTFLNKKMCSQPKNFSPKKFLILTVK